jgi:hypothetical protein
MVRGNAMKADRVIFLVRCHGTPDEELEQEIVDKICDAVSYPDKGWGILTVGRQYFHDHTARCSGHATPDEECEETR